MSRQDQRPKKLETSTPEDKNSSVKCIFQTLFFATNPWENNSSFSSPTSQLRTEPRWSSASLWALCSSSSSCWSSSRSFTGSWATCAAMRRSSPTISGNVQHCSLERFLLVFIYNEKMRKKLLPLLGLSSLVEGNARSGLNIILCDF